MQNKNFSILEQWLNLFDSKLISLGISMQTLEEYKKRYGREITPIIYCCLLHRKVIPKPRNFFESKEFSQKKTNKCSKIIKDIRMGFDISPYMSKRLKEWEMTDMLLFFSNIYHIHLTKNKQGGIGDDLIFGIFTDDSFYAIDLGVHDDLYNLDKLIQII